MDSINFHKQLKGKIEIISRAKLNTKEDLSLAYTPGVAEPCKEIFRDKEKVYDYTRKNNLVAVVTDGSAVLGLGNIGPEAALPVMEGKAILFKEFAGVDAFPIALKTQDVDEIVRTVELISPIFGGINLEDIAAPRCFEVEKKLQEKLDIPVFHDDQHGTAIVVLAGIINALQIVKKNINEVKVVINGAGAAGNAIAHLLLFAGAKNLILVDSKGTIYEGRENMDLEKNKLALITNRNLIKGSLKEALMNADIFIGVSKAGLLNKEMVKTMNKEAIIFALANPVPEIMPDEAKKGGARIVATGRSDFPNQVNNVLVFPGIFRGLLDAKIKIVTMGMQYEVAKALANYVKNCDEENIIPNALDKEVSGVVAKSIKKFKKLI